MRLGVISPFIVASGCGSSSWYAGGTVLDPFESVVSILRPRFVVRRMLCGVFDILGRGVASEGDVGESVGATVVAGVIEAASAELMLENVMIVSREALLRT